MNRIRNKVKEFSRQFGISYPTAADLCDALRKQGFTVVFFKSHEDDPDIINVLTGLGLKAYAKSARGFTYADGDTRLVFVSDELNEEERLIVLSHEQGHISCGHIGRSKVVGIDVREEHEAAEFSHYLIRKRRFPSHFIRTHRVLCRVAAALIAAAVIIGCVAVYLKTYPTDIGRFYVTTSGERYHRRDCYIIKDKKGIHRITEKEFESGEFSPCRICLPND